MGSNLHVVDDYGKMSHFIWRDAEDDFSGGRITRRTGISFISIGI